MNKKNVFSVVILFLILSITVGFSAFASEMSIGSIAADVRVKKDIRITGISITGGTTSGSVNTLNWDTDSVMLGDLISGIDNNVNLEITITNFESTEMGIFNINVPEGIDYDLTDYSLGNKICDTNGKCNLGISKTINLNVLNTSDSVIDESVKVDFDFREMHTITYEGITNDGYPTEIISGGDLSITFTDDIPENLVIYNDNIKVDSAKYTYTNNTLTFNDVSGNLTIKSAKNLFNIIKLKTNGVDTNIDFASASSETNGDGVNTISGTESNDYPVYYYRGGVTDNNVQFAGFCWKMVRTTDTGGVKLIYNGVPAEDGSCDNTGEASQIGTSVFNEEYNSPAYVGYMYGTVYTATTKDLSAQTDTYVYGNDVSWDGTNYTLSDTMSSSSWSTDRTTLATKYHYTCFNDTGVCDKVYYINYFGNASNAYYLTLSGGKDIETAKEEMFVNTTDSKIKTTIDTWYASNMTNYTSMLEDTVWCNDRTLIGGPLYSKDTNGTSSSLFGAYTRNMSTFKPSLSCTRSLDSFTVKSSNGNGELTYPVGLLTADEYTLAGSGNKGYSTSVYLYTGKTQWTLSPSYLGSSSVRGIYLYSVGNLGSTYVGEERGVNPSVSLQVGTLITSGDGTVTSPYIVE